MPLSLSRVVVLVPYLVGGRQLEVDLLVCVHGTQRTDESRLGRSLGSYGPGLRKGVVLLCPQMSTGVPAPPSPFMPKFSAGTSRLLCRTLPLSVRSPDSTPHLHICRDSTRSSAVPFTHRLTVPLLLQQRISETDLDPVVVIGRPILCRQFPLSLNDN